MFGFGRKTRVDDAVVHAFHAAAPRFQAPEDMLAQMAYAGVVHDVFSRYGVADYGALTPRVMHELALVLVLIHEDRAAFDRAMVIGGIAIDDVVALRREARRYPELVERARLALCARIAEARALRSAYRPPEPRQLVA